MLKVRLGSLLVSYPLAFMFATTLGSHACSAAGPDAHTTGDVVTFVGFGYLLPLLVAFAGILLTLIGLVSVRRVAKQNLSAPSGGSGAAQAPTFPRFFVAAAVVGLLFTTAVGYGGGEAFTYPPERLLAERIVQQWARCLDDMEEFTPESVAAKIGTREWSTERAERCAVCWEDLDTCAERRRCLADCTFWATLETFGGSATPEVYGTWDTIESDGQGFSQTFEPAGRFHTMNGVGGPTTTRGRWAARPTDVAGMLELLLEFDRPSDSAPILMPIQMIDADHFRATVNNSLFTRHSSTPAVVVPAGPSADRIAQCRRACGGYRQCMRDNGDQYYCADDLTRACRECRSDGLGR